MEVSGPDTINFFFNNGTPTIFIQKEPLNNNNKNVNRTITLLHYIFVSKKYGMILTNLDVVEMFRDVRSTAKNKDDNKLFFSLN